MLGDFLKTRRARLSPEAVGLPLGKRWRATGLRREEVAQLADVSVTWYTWIEQGRQINVSETVLMSIAKALQLSVQEQRYMFTLAGAPLLHLNRQCEYTVDLDIKRMLDHQRHYPAYLLGRYWDLLAWNWSAVHLFGNFADMPIGERNMVWYAFVRPETSQLMMNWEECAKRLVAEFRADCSPHISEKAFIAFLDRVKQRSPVFAHWWQTHDVASRDGVRKQFNHPRVGMVELQQKTLRVGNYRDIQMVVYIPSTEWDSETKLRQLYDENHGRAKSSDG